MKSAKFAIHAGDKMFYVAFNYEDDQPMPTANWVYDLIHRGVPGAPGSTQPGVVWDGLYVKPETVWAVELIKE